MLYETGEEPNFRDHIYSERERETGGWPDWARISLQGEFFYLQFIGCLISFEKWCWIALFIGISVGSDFIGDLRAFVLVEWVFCWEKNLGYTLKKST